MTAKVKSAESMTDDWFDADIQAGIAKAIGFNVVEVANLWQRIAEGKRRD